VLQNLLLPFKSQLERLHSVELYLSRRRSESSFPSRKVFTDLGSWDCLAVKFFDQSSSHKDLRMRIEREAQKSRDKKIAEPLSLKEKYRELIRQLEVP